MTRVEEFRRGWPATLVSVVGVAVGVSSITLYTSGLFTLPLEQATGWSRALISSGSIASTLGMAIGAPFVGRLIDRHGSHIVAGLSLLALAACYAVLGLLPLTPPRYLGLLFLGGLLGSGSMPMAYMRVLSAWFDGARGLAMGIALAGAGFAGILAPLLLGGLIHQHGYQAGFLSIGAAIGLGAALVFLMLRMPRELQKSGRAGALAGVSFAEAWRTAVFWILAISFGLAAMSISALIFHFVPIMTSLGLPEARAIHLASMIGASVIVSRLITGYALDRLGAPIIGVVVFLAAAAGCLLLYGNGAAMALLAGLFISFALGTEIDLVGFSIAQRFGLRSYAHIYGCMMSVFLIGSGLGPFLFGVLYERGGSYETALPIAADLLAMAAILQAALLRERFRS